MVNHDNKLVAKNEYGLILGPKEEVDYSNTNQESMMMRRSDNANVVQEKQIQDDIDAPIVEKQIGESATNNQPTPVNTNVKAANDSNAISAKLAGMKDKSNDLMQKQGQPQQQVVQQSKPVQPASVSQNVPQTQVQNKVQPKPQAKSVQQPAFNLTNIGAKLNYDELTDIYIKMIKDFIGVDVNYNICRENMRKLCEINTKNPGENLYFIENTYRISTLMYLANNLPIVIGILFAAETNRKYVYNAISKEIEFCAKNFQEVKEEKLRRWSAKFSANMYSYDSMTITLGVTSMNPDLKQILYKNFADICVKSKKICKDLTNIISKYSDADMNDVVYICSNFWYFLQCFEHIDEFRNFVMELIDTGCKKLKIDNI